MSTSQEAPSLIQYACERCKTRFVLPPSRRKLSIGGKFRSLSMGLSRTFRYHEGLGSSYDAARRQMLAKMDDEAYQSFVQSFRFCHECRQFVCNECWSTSRRSCLTCVAKSMTGTARPRPPFAPTGPEIPRPIAAAVAPLRKGRARRDAALVGLGLALVLLVVEGGILLANGNGGTAAIATATPSASPTGTPTATPTAIPTLSAAPTVVPTPTAVPTPVPTLSLTATPTAAIATPTARITPKPTPTKAPTAVPTTAPAVTPVPDPVVTCSLVTGGVSCYWNHWKRGETVIWYVARDPSPSWDTYRAYDLVVQLSPGTYNIWMSAQLSADPVYSSPIVVTVPLA